LPNEHATWPLHCAELVDVTDDLVAAAGVAVGGPMLRPLYSPGCTPLGSVARAVR
ncbi:DUF2071 domain-containing protein, partial [Mycobacterium rufum]|nr:DUF2071 domain-containing protein [Mycolicibacterium rufum]